MGAAEPFVLNPDNRPLLGEGAPTTALAEERDGLRDGSFLLFIGSVMFVLFLIIMLIAAIFSWWDLAALYRSSVQIEATVTGRHIDEGSEHAHYYVSYTYEYVRAHGEPQTYARSERVDHATYASATEGAPITVAHTPTDPERASLDLSLAPPWWDLAHVVIVPLGMGALPALLGVGLHVLARRRLHIVRRLREQSSKAAGEVVECKDTATDENYYIKLTYRFQSPQSGKTIQQAHRLLRDDLRQAALPPPGTPVVVLYRDDKTYWIL
jgi:hypothetical protein